MLEYLIALNQRVLEALVDIIVPGVWWIDFFPWLKGIPSWVPGATFQKRAAYFRKSILNAIEVPFQTARSNKAVSETLLSSEGCPSTRIFQENKYPSFISMVPRALDTSESDMAILKDAAAVAYIGLLLFNDSPRCGTNAADSWF